LERKSEKGGGSVGRRSDFELAAKPGQGEQQSPQQQQQE